VKKICLVTTSLENSEIEGKNIYLGNWCKNDDYTIKNQSVVPYHWDDREKLEKDNEYINKLYEKILADLSTTLNKRHKKNYSKEYWRLVIGYWLFLFLSTMFDKWESINNAFKLFDEINYTKTFKFFNKKQPISKTTKEFINLCSDTKWNHLIYSEMITYLITQKKINIEIEQGYYTKDNFYYIYKENYKNKLKKRIIDLYNKLTTVLRKTNKVVIYKSYIGLLNELRLNLYFNQLPIFFNNHNFNSKVDFELRNNLKININISNSFEGFIKECIFKNIPKEFIEDYKNIDSYLENLNLPDNPKVILATTILLKENIFSRYCAQKKELGTKLIYCQHGGAYGQIKFSWAEDHEVSICDEYLSWGWTDDNKKITKFGIIKNIEKLKFKKFNKIYSAAYFLRSRPKFVHRIDSSSGTNQMSKYYLNSIDFFKQKEKMNVKLKIIPRFHEAMFDWNHLEIWDKKFSPKLEKKLTFDEDLEEVYKNYDIIIYSYIGTGFLESLAMDKPFIVIAPLNEWPLRENVIDDFANLKKAKIFFDNNEEALKHLNSIVDNSLNWWDSDFTKKVKNDFKEKYAKKLTNKTKIKELIKILNKHI
jgi:putative transferase (TIGR04331 family)